MARSCLSVVLAAGEGTRMRSTRPKVLHSVAGLSMLSHVLQSASRAGAGKISVVVGAQADAVAAEASRFDPSITVFTQEPRLGTAHAVLSAREAISEGYDDVLVLFGDTPLVTPKSLLRLRKALADGADVAVMGFRTDRPEGYGRLIERNGVVEAIREHRDANAEELAINFCNGGIMGISGRHVLADLKAIGNDNAKGEFYLTDIVTVARERGGKVVAVEAEEAEVLGVNDPAQLAAVEAIWQTRRRRELMLAGVLMQAPETVFLSHDTRIGEETEIEPNVVFGPGVELAAGTHIRAFSHLEGCRVSTGAVVGPYARLRPGTSLADDVKVGNFCELKNAEIGQGAKINHLSYVGDASVGAGSNLGAGTITCNYDGQTKHHTEIGKSAFIGSNSSLVAPITIGDGAYVGSGSVVVEDVPDDALALARGRQVNKEGYARRFKNKADAKH